MSYSLKNVKLITTLEQLKEIPAGKRLINCINAHSYNTALENEKFARVLFNENYYHIPDGVGVIWGCRFLNVRPRPENRIVGWDLFVTEMEALKAKTRSDANDKEKPLVMFVGSTEATLAKIRARVEAEYPMFRIATYSPSFCKEFSEEEKQDIINAINAAQPSLLWIGITAPKQEILADAIYDRLNINCHIGTIGAVFDFYSGNIKRAPMWFQRHGLEWFYRFCQEPRRLWRRYMLGNMIFVYHMTKEKLGFQ